MSKNESNQMSRVRVEHSISGADRLKPEEKSVSGAGALMPVSNDNEQQATEKESSSTEG